MANKRKKIIQGPIDLIYKIGGKILDQVRVYSTLNQDSNNVKQIVIEDHYSNHVSYQVVKEITKTAQSEKIINKFNQKFRILSKRV